MTEGGTSRSFVTALFMSLFCLQILFLEGHINTPDGQVMFDVSAAMLDKNAADISPIFGKEFGGSRSLRADNTRFYSKYGLGLSLMALPTLLLGDLLEPLVQKNDVKIFWHYEDQLAQINSKYSGAEFSRVVWYDRDIKPYSWPLRIYFATWTNCWIVAGIGAVLYLLGMSYGWGIAVSLGIAFSANFTTPLWHYAGEFFSEPLSAFCLVLLLYCWRISFRHKERRCFHAWLGGFALGFAVLTKAANIGVAPWAGIYAMLGLSDARFSRRDRWRWILAMGLGIAGPLLLFLVYNYSRYGFFFETGYRDEARSFTTPLLTGLYGLVFSPGRGILWYFPAVILGVLGYKRFLREERADAVFVGGVGLTWLGLYAKWSAWEGGWCWGPRFLVPIIPLMLLPAASLVKDLWRCGAAQRALITLVGTVAFLVAMSGVMVNYLPYYIWVRKVYETQKGVFASLGYANYGELSLFSWHYSPLWRHFIFPVRQQPVLVTSLHYPGLILVVNIVLFGLSLFALAWLLIDSIRRSRSVTLSRS